MIAKDTFTSYSQYNEDIILAALLSNVKHGFYVDVGANHESYHSVTKFFYQRGWRGINIEPIPRLITEFSTKRTRDTNLQLAVSREKGSMTLRDYTQHDGFSTLDAASKEDPAKVGLPFTDYTVQVDSLRNIFRDHDVRHIDFLKVDVEGYEFEVLRSNDWQKFRPTALCIEANHRLGDWGDYIESQKYERVIFDGLNEYYLAAESMQLMDGFADRATLLAHNSLRDHHRKLWESDIKRIAFLEDFTEQQDALIKSTQASLLAIQDEAEKLRAQSLSGHPLLARFVIALKGLTTGYLRDKKSARKR